MIYLDIITSLERALGTSLDPAQRTSVVYSLAADLGGERQDRDGLRGEWSRRSAR